MVDVLVVSDLHGMSPEVEVGRFVRFVEANPSKVLVLAGDTLDFYIWRHGRGRVDVEAGMVLLRFLLGLAKKGVELVILPGNHDLEWMWLVGMGPKRWPKRVYPEGMEVLLKELVGKPNVRVVDELDVGGTMIVHGHLGWHGDWLWRVSELGDKATGYRFVGGQMRRKVMGVAPMRVRAAAVGVHGFYRRLAGWARKRGLKHIIHGHTHVDGRRVRKGVVMDCLPAWRPSEGRGGGMVLKSGVWARVEVE